MSVINTMLLIIVGLAFIVLAAGFVYVIVRNVRQGRVFREKLAARVESLRMGRMLRARGIDVAAYLHQTHVSEISQHASQCDQCETTDICDSHLARGKLDASDIGFCPNQHSLSTFDDDTRKGEKAS